MQQILHRSVGISLRDVLPKARFVRGGDVRITSCCGDWRSCRPGDLYVAVTGADQDGHDFVHEAIERGAAAVLAEQLLPIDVPTCIVPDTREAFGRVCQALAGRPTEQMRVIGITGTNGKTTTAMLIASVLEAARKRVGITSTLGYCDWLETAAAQQTTPEPPELANWLARMLANGCSYAVVEASSRALAQRQLAGMQFDAAVLTNVRRDHLDFHGSVLNYRQAKGRLLEQIKPHGFAVLNTDDPASQHFLSHLDAPVLTIGMRTPAELMATVIERHKSEQTFLLTAGNESVPARTRMIGDHHIYNCLAAAAVGLVMGIDLPTVVRGLESLECVAGRMERIECGQPFGVFVDAARTPDRLAVALNSLRQVTPGRVICVFGSEADGDKDARPLLGRVAERGADLGIITSDNPRHEEPLQIAHDIIDGYERPARSHVLPNRGEAIHFALSQAKPGDTVLIAGKGHEDFHVVGQLRHHFDDRQIVRDWLYQAGAKKDRPRTLAFTQS